ncbi:MAG: polysaccharide deacetylase [Bacteroidetes bacterium]|nr:polysaccharide deacetylase [Bacteroidota bacterium]
MLKRAWSLFFFLTVLMAAGQEISNYHPISALNMPGEKLSRLLALRQFNRGNSTFYWVVNTSTLETSVISPQEIKFTPCSFDSACALLRETAYVKALKDALANSMKLQDAGITHSIPSERGIVLTIDLCPSSKKLDRELFTRTISILGKKESPVPLAISVSGSWMKEHPDDLTWILELVRNKKIHVDWINHSFTHPTSKTLPLDRNFLLEKGTSIREEVLKNEALMLECGILPSVFFRFPGLVSDQTIFDEICSFGLIPVGSDAWLAKNQEPNKGSIVLIHGNGNEPLGIEKFFQLISEEKIAIKNNNWLLYDLRESIQEKEEYKQ